MKEHIPLKYECLDKYADVISKCSDNAAKQLLVEMFELIRYQMGEIQHQRMTIIAQKHREFWTHYDRPLDQYDTGQRKYVYKPPKSDNMSC